MAAARVSRATERLHKLSDPQLFARYPLVEIAVAYGLGIVSALCGQLTLPALIVSAALATSLLVAILISSIRENRKEKQRMLTLLVLLIFVLLGAASKRVENDRTPSTQLKSLLEQGTVAVGEPVELTGVLEREPEDARERLYLELRLEKIRARVTDNDTSIGRSSERDVSGVVTLFAPVSSRDTKLEYDELGLRYGGRIRVMTLLERADSFRNPGGSSFTEYLDRKGYDATGFVKSPLLIERLDDQQVFLPLAVLYEWRRKLQTEIDKHFSAETAGVLDAAFLGNRYNLDSSAAERFREGGTFHILVISGLHITMLGGLVFLIAKRFTRKRWLQFLVSAAALWAYSLAVGAESSVVRSALMFTFVLLGPVVSRRASSLNTLGAAALILLVRTPDELFDPSFQLTFASVLAMVVCAWPLMEKLAQIGSWRPTRETPYPPLCAPWLRSFCESLFWSERKAEQERERLTYGYRVFKSPLATRLERLHLQRPLRYAFGAILVSATVQLALLPFLVVYFHRVSIAAVLLNIGVSLLMGAEALAATVGLVLAQLNDGVARPFIALAEALNWSMVHTVDPFSRLNLASLRLPEYTGWARAIYVLCYFPFILLVALLARWQPLALIRPRPRIRKLAAGASLSLVIAIALIVFHPFSAAAPTGELRVDFLDVGQGDSALVTFPDGTTMLVDGGGRPGPFQKEQLDEEDETFERETRSIGDAVVSEYLWWRGLDHVDYILATHADADHIDGLNDIARNFKVSAALVARAPVKDGEFQKFSRTLAEKRVPLRLIGAGDILHFGEVTAEVLWPAPSVNVNDSSRNNDSIVLRLRLGARSMLLTGDVEMAGERGILSRAKELSADVVKVAHHGSKTSSTDAFVQATKPKFAVISVGQTSIFGHPNAEVVKRWADNGAQVLTTGKCGTITVVTNGRDLSIDRFVK
ncbi:MAG TPA: ComEC/Rec2 family competence protein [Pyrinomonadaceae bacterium]|nr:ComEC/Rec2 family competence protein [Pyrinomonadaceae bacterium]